MNDRSLHIKESELRALVEVLVRQALIDMLGLHGAVPSPEPAWEEPAIAEKKLNCKPGELGRKRRSGWFVEGVHFRISNNDPNAASYGVRHEYHVENCRKRLSERRSKW